MIILYATGVAPVFQQMISTRCKILRLLLHLIPYDQHRYLPEKCSRISEIPEELQAVMKIDYDDH